MSSFIHAKWVLGLPSTAFFDRGCPLSLYNTWNHVKGELKASCYCPLPNLMKITRLTFSLSDLDLSTTLPLDPRNKEIVGSGLIIRRITTESALLRWWFGQCCWRVVFMRNNLKRCILISTGVYLSLCGITPMYSPGCVAFSVQSFLSLTLAINISSV